MFLFLTVIVCVSVFLLVRSCLSWSPNSTDLYFWYLFVELAVATPVEWRNFVSVVPAAKKSQLGPIFFSKYPCYIQTVCEKARNRTKNGQKTSKKTVFLSAPLTNFCGSATKVGQRGWWKHLFLEGFCPFYVLFLAFSWTICVWNAFFAKKIVPFDLL